ncbi:MAG TPA: PfkB family carbohydrate kinase, partial [Acidobacteriota bacterium]|nr:PfkB family carbohydrate kinase [Acidobacteriota bacterium]
MSLRMGWFTLWNDVPQCENQKKQTDRDIPSFLETIGTSCFNSKTCREMRRQHTPLPMMKSDSFSSGTNFLSHRSPDWKPLRIGGGILSQNYAGTWITGDDLFARTGGNSKYNDIMSRVLVAGGVSYNTMIYLERFPEPRSQTLFSRDFHETVGATGAGKALNLRKLGMEVTLHAMIGDDDAGGKIRAGMEREGIRFLYDIDPKGTERHVNLMEDGGGRISIYISYATFEPEIDEPRIESLLGDEDYIVLNILNYCRRLIPAIRRHNKPIWCDIHDYDGKKDYHRDFVEAADFLFMSSDAMNDYRAFMQGMIDRGKQLVVCTHGRNGSTALTKDGQWLQTPILQDYRRVDTNGAGDSFFAGFLYAWDRRYPIERCLKIATVVSGLCVTSRELAYPDLTPDLVEREYKKYYG